MPTESNISPRVEIPELPEGWRLDPEVRNQGARAAVTGHAIYWVILPDGTRTAWNGEDVLCPVCTADPEKMPDCNTCVGRGTVDSIPYCDRPWDLIVRNGLGGELWLGGIHCQFGHPDAPGGNALPEDRFDVVVSLTDQPGYEPAEGTTFYVYRIADADLDPEHHTKLDGLAAAIVDDLNVGRKVLVRCQAGINRSALVVGLTMLKLGVSVDTALLMMRELRSPYVLCNQSFVAYLREVEAR